LGLFRLFREKNKDAIAANLYSAVVTRAREPVFYLDFGVPDTVEGRFEMIALHVFLVLWRLKAERENTAAMAQALFDRMFLDMDENLRELGVGDLSVGSRVKKMAKAFYGRTAAYEEGIEQGEEKLARALRRNLYGNSGTESAVVAAMARYVLNQARSLKETTLETVLSAEAPLFAPKPTRDEIEADK
jgi:cytochrome b pre-mRNA-processing protein 3